MAKSTSGTTERLPYTQTRRKFLDILLGAGALAWLASLFYPIAKYLVPPQIPEISIDSIEVGTLSEFPPGSSKIIRFGRKPVIVFRQKNGAFHALSATCTHLDCTVQFKSDTEQIWCACHNGLYDVDGRNISGPPPRPLAQFQIVVSGDKVIVSRDQQV
jgi:Rieske Fe-S protein